MSPEEQAAARARCDAADWRGKEWADVLTAALDALAASLAECEKLRAALADLDAAYARREHGGVAEGRFVQAVRSALGDPT